MKKGRGLHEKHVSTVHSSSHVGLNWEFDGGETGAMVVVIRVSFWIYDGYFRISGEA